MKFLNKFNKLVILFFVIYFIIGSLIFRDYGISWDEPYQRQIGYVSFEYIRGDNSLLQFTDRYYGVIVELPLVIIERVFKINDTQSIYFFRHYFNFLLFYIGVIFFYLLNKKLFKSWKLALLGCLLLIFHPRIFAHSFYNSKDIPFLVFYIISTYTLFNYYSNKSKKNLIIHSLASALTINSRVVGVIVFVVTNLAILINKNKQRVNSIILYSIGTSFFTYLIWPILWRNPLNIFNAINLMRNFSYQENLPVLYMGKYISTFALPWHYLPIWIAITTPITFLLLYLVGTYHSIIELKKISKEKLIENITLFILLFLPIVSAILFRSTLYDGWRHFYFIYPIMVIFMLKGFKFVNKAFVSLFIVEIVFTLALIMISHPYQQVYFNILFQNKFVNLKQLFEFDYWGLSYRHALEDIVKNDDSERIEIVVANNPGNSNSLIINKEDRNRIFYLSEDDIEKADYYIGNYRWHKSEYNYGREVFSEYVFGTKIITVQKLEK